MEHMYVHRVVLGECVGMLVAIYIGYSIIRCIQDLELSNMQLSCCRSFSAAKILPNPKLEK